MEIHLALLQEYPHLNSAQTGIICHDEGPLLVIAGPGSGKTLSMILRAMNLLLHERAKPEEIVLCTFTEKAAHEMQNRIAALAQKIHYSGDLSYLRIDTIHSICNQLISNHLHHTPLSNGYQTLEEFTEHLFLLKHFREICQGDVLNLFMNKWETAWNAAGELQKYFDKITEEFVTVRSLSSGKSQFQRYLGKAYSEYQQILIRENCVTFSALQKIAYNLLKKPKVADKITRGIRYVFVDEYQDTNFLQEHIVLKLASATGNICVVGDEDQALYRFRGATVRNILEFESTAKKEFRCCKRIDLTTNYRSHAQIIHAYDCWMASADWSEGDGKWFRTDKTIQPDPAAKADYRSVFSITGKDINDEAEQFADFVAFLKRQDIIEDYNQVALLLYSVKPLYSNSYLDALRRRGIEAFCPRARSYFERAEIRQMMACFAELFDAGRQDMDKGFADYLDGCLNEFKHAGAYPLLHETIGSFKEEIALLENDQELDRRLSDYFYRLLALEPFAGYMRENASQMRNLVIFSQGLDTFQKFYPHPGLASHNHREIREQLFRKFLYFWQYAGVNEYEDAENPFPAGAVPIMTIHQAKGLEFPVVVVGSLGEGRSGGNEVDRVLHELYQRQPLEPEKCIPRFDAMRLYYVAFSRAKKLLVLTGNQRRQPNALFDTIWSGLPQWSDVKDELAGLPKSVWYDEPQKPVVAKPRYSFTGHIKMYETCPRQFQFYRECEFRPSRPGEVLLGLLVHQTIEEIHRAFKDGDRTVLNEESIHSRVKKNFDLLRRTYMQPVDSTLEEEACRQIINYVIQNREELEHIFEAELQVAVDRGEYILTGRVDLLIQREHGLEVLDFKTARRPVVPDDVLLDYERQLCAYASAVERRYGKKPGKLSIYWTGEERKEDALMEFPYCSDTVERAECSFDAVVTSIKKKDFRVVVPPEPHVCKRCDMQHLCISEGVIDPQA